MENLFSTTLSEQREEIHYSSKIHWISSIVQIVLLLNILPWFLLALLTKYYVIAGLLGLIVFKGVMKIVRNKCTKILLSKNYLTLITGVIGKQTVDIPLSKLEGVVLNQSSLGRILGFGTLTVTTGQVSTSYKISNPNKLRFEILKNKQ